MDTKTETPSFTQATAYRYVIGTGRRRGRKPGVKTVTLDISERRRQWLQNYVRSGHGRNAALCASMKMSDSFVSHLTSGRRTFTDSLARRIEEVLGLNVGDIDAGVIPASTTAPKTGVLHPGIKHALVSLLLAALLTNRIDNSKAIRLISEVIDK